jgi:hypothetical protein
MAVHLAQPLTLSTHSLRASIDSERVISTHSAAVAHTPCFGQLCGLAYPRPLLAVLMNECPAAPSHLALHRGQRSGHGTDSMIAGIIS